MSEQRKQQKESKSAPLTKEFKEKPDMADSVQLPKTELKKIPE